MVKFIATGQKAKFIGAKDDRVIIMGCLPIGLEMEAMYDWRENDDGELPAFRFEIQEGGTVVNHFKLDEFELV